ncbi:transcription factor RFX3 [Leptidea sinapis]|uniref:transcription factor RFX3 n=1 Tax=Leptidea sinapis TaxID=189913 RepID=UPI0021C420AD|nr:transcription factor RFX3 [Leptidea sinapis]
MAAQLAAPAQGAGAGSGSPSGRDLIVIPEITSTLHLQHAIQVTTSVVGVNGDSSGHSSPTPDTQHTYIVARLRNDGDEEFQLKSEGSTDEECEGGNGVNYHVQYVEPQEMYTQAPQTTMETLRAYPMFEVTSVETVSTEGADEAWGGQYAFAESAPVEGGAGAGAAGAAGAGAAGAGPTSPSGPARMPPATVQWLLEHYETAEGVSLPRSTLYAHYLRHCTSHRLDPVNAASFGKLIRSVFVGLRTRRLGTRGNSKYHYYGIRAKPSAHKDSAHHKLDLDDNQDGRDRSPDRNQIEAEGSLGANHRQYLGGVMAPDPPELFMEDIPDDVPPDAIRTLVEHHRQNGVEFLEAVAALDTCGVERARRNFWKCESTALCRRTLARLAARRHLALWLRRADLRLYQRAADLLLPDVLSPIPSHLTQAIRNFAKTLESALSAGSAGAPTISARAQNVAAACLSAALRRYTSLNHLAQAARAVLANHHQIHQMVSDLSRVDFRVVREQAGWACAAPGETHRSAHDFDADFKTSFQATLGRGMSLEQWAGWLERGVRAALAPHSGRSDYTPRARRLLLDCSFYSSLVIRELTLRSAASFGSFHLIRLLYDEYVAYLVERRIADHRREPPVAVMQRAHDDDDEIPERSNMEEARAREGERESAADDDGDEWEWAEDDDDDDDEDGKKPRMAE